MIELLIANWLWILALGLFVALHRSGHGCGMHGSHQGHGHQSHHDRQSHHDHTGPAEPAGTERKPT